MFLAECVNIDAVEEAAQHELVIVRKMGETVGNALVDNSGYEAVHHHLRRRVPVGVGHSHNVGHHRCLCAVENGGGEHVSMTDLVGSVDRLPTVTQTIAEIQCPRPFFGGLHLRRNCCVEHEGRVLGPGCSVSKNKVVLRRCLLGHVGDGEVGNLNGCQGVGKPEGGTNSFVNTLGHSTINIMRGTPSCHQIAAIGGPNGSGNAQSFRLQAFSNLCRPRSHLRIRHLREGQLANPVASIPGRRQRNGGPLHHLESDTHMLRNHTHAR